MAQWIRNVLGSEVVIIIITSGQRILMTGHIAVLSTLATTNGFVPVLTPV